MDDYKTMAFIMSEANDEIDELRDAIRTVVERARAECKKRRNGPRNRCSRPFAMQCTACPLHAVAELLPLVEDET